MCSSDLLREQSLRSAIFGNLLPTRRVECGVFRGEWIATSHRVAPPEFVARHLEEKAVMARSHRRLSTLTVVSLLFLGVAVGMPRFSPSAESSPAETRAKGRQLLQQGNFKESWELFRKLAANPQAGSAEAAGDVQAAVQSAMNVGRTEEIGRAHV